MAVVAGINARNAVKSAKISGYEVFAVAKYCDEDLKLYADEYYRFDENSVELVVRLCEAKGTFAVLTTGMEKFASRIRRKVEVAGSFDDRCLDKLKFYRELERAGIAYPEIGESFENGKIILKPRFGGGGAGIVFSGDFSGDFEALKFESERDERGKKREYIPQKYVEGETISAIVLSSSSCTKCIAINKLLSGWKEMNACGFLYSGNVTPVEAVSPLSRDVLVKARRASEEVASLFDVEGCCGVDMVVCNDSVFVLELNPRIPGSLDSFELSHDASLFDLHVKAFEGKLNLKDLKLKPKRVACRAIYYSPSELRAYISPHSPFFADIPRWGEEFERYQPVTSIISTGNGAEVLNKVLERKKLLERLCLKFSEI